MAIIGIPPAAGGIVAYFSPPRGWGGRSLSFIVYASCQFALAIIATIRNAVDDGPPRSATAGQPNPAEDDHQSRVNKGRPDAHPKPPSKESLRKTFKWLLTGKSFRIICSIFWSFSLLASIGGTTMQITGVYRNCFCYAGANN
jgi:hypothetical protein